jgi:hypothetical protein
MICWIERHMLVSFTRRVEIARYDRMAKSKLEVKDWMEHM